ncbi:ANTAR domain-containing protein [Streptomyces sp. NPDC055085]
MVLPTHVSVRKSDPCSGAGLPIPESQREVLALRDEVAGLKRALWTHALIDLARGVVMATTGCSAETAWAVLVHTSQHTNIKLHTIARLVVDAAEGSEPPAVVREALHAAFTDYEAGVSPSGDTDDRAPDDRRPSPPATGPGA